jgi:PST family polysaccharide transporter
MVRFAMNTYGHFATNYCTRNLDNFLVAWFFGAPALGFYKKAYDLCVLPVAQLADPLNAVAVPVLSRLAGDPERHRRYVLRALATLAFAGMGLSACLSLVGQDLILVLLGPQWRESGRIFTFFAPGIGAMLLYLTYGCIHLSIGRADRLFRWAVIELAVLGSLFVAGLHWGPVGVATAWVVACWVLTIPALWYAGKPAGLGMTTIVGALWKYAAAAPLAVSAVTAIVNRVPALAAAPGVLGAVDRIATRSLLFGVLYLAAVVVLHRGVKPLRDVVSLVRHLLPARPPQCTTLTLVGGVGPAAVE